MIKKISSFKKLEIFLIIFFFRIPVLHRVAVQKILLPLEITSK